MTAPVPIISGIETRQTFTPAPWTARYYHQHTEVTAKADGCSYVVARCGAHHYITEEQAQANASLIAAAPAMLQALENASSLFRIMTAAGMLDDTRGIHPNTINNVIDNINAVLDRATGA